MIIFIALIHVSNMKLQHEGMKKKLGKSLNIFGSMTIHGCVFVVMDFYDGTDHKMMHDFCSTGLLIF